VAKLIFTERSFAKVVPQLTIVFGLCKSLYLKGLAPEKTHLTMAGNVWVRNGGFKWDENCQFWKSKVNCNEKPENRLQNPVEDQKL
jgi:hypothetical protein